MSLRQHGIVQNIEVGARALFQRATRGSLVTGASTLLLMRMFSFGLTFMIGLLLARLLGSQTFGRYSFVISLITLLVLATSVGFPRLLLRDVSAYRSKARWGEIKGLIRISNAAIGAAAVVVGAICFGALELGVGRSAAGPSLDAFLVALPLLLILPWTQARSTILMGLDRVIEGQIPLLIVQPVALLSAVLVTFYLFGAPRNAETALALRLAAELTSCLVAMLVLRLNMTAEITKAEPVYDVRALSGSLFFFVLIQGMQTCMQQTDIIVLGLMRPMSDVGIYRIATAGTQIVTFAAFMTATRLAPIIAHDWARDARASIQQAVTRMARIGFVAAVALCVVAVALIGPIIAILGKDYHGLGAPLIILGVGQVVCSLAMASGPLLTMTGHERSTAITVTCVAAVNLGLNLWLVPLFGTVGAAVATSSSAILAMTVLSVRAIQTTRIDPTVLGRFAARPAPTASSSVDGE